MYLATVNIVSLNVRGLYASGKWHNLFRELKWLQCDIVSLQETDLTHTTSTKTILTWVSSMVLWTYGRL